jgi:hypothetical protein
MKYLESSYSGTWTGICIRDLILQKTIVLPEELAMSSHHGLAWDGSGFWVSDSQLLAKVGSDGAPIASHYYNYIEWPLRDFDSLCWDGSVLWAVEDPTQEDYSKAQFCRIDTTSGEVMSSIPCPPDGSSPSLSPFGLGLAYDGTAMYCLRNSNDGTQLIYKIDRSTGAVLGTLPAPESVYDGTAMPGGFGAAGTDLYFSDRSGYLYKLRSSDGKVMRRFTYTDWSMGGSPGGVAWDGTCLWVRDTMEGRLNGFSVPTGLVP